MANERARPSFFAAVAAIAEVVDTDPRVQSALTFLEAAGLTATARIVREVTKKAPELVQGVAVAAVANLKGEAAALDEAIARKLSREVDQALVRGGARVPKEKRLRAGSKSRAAEAARRSRSKR